jgi:choline dehydrogenase-like flavoprotein
MSMPHTQTDELRKAAERKMYDVCVIGSGAAGGVVAHRCVEEGLSVLVLEQGTRAPTAVRYWDAAAPRGGQAIARGRDGRWTLSGRAWTSCNIGGGTIYYGAASFRFREADFDSSELFNTDLDVRWPLAYADLEPYYDHVERALRVARADTGDPTAPPASPGFPPVPPSVPGARLRDAALRLGLHPFPTPLAVNTIPGADRGLCTRCSGCIDYPCPTGAKGDVEAVWLAPLARRPNYRLLDLSRAARLILGRGDRVTAVECLDLKARQIRRFAAQRFVLAANAVQSAALLLRSACPRAPAGLGNDQDMVGRGLCLKLSRYVAGDAPGEPGLSPEALYGPFSTISIADYYFGSDALQPGGLIYESKPSETRDQPSDRLYLRVETILPDTPRRDNRVRLASCLDADGLAMVVIDYRPTASDLLRLDALTQKATDILRAASGRGIHIIDSEFYLGSGHLHGGCRAGRDPRDSVVDRDGRVHSLANVFVADGGFMPYPSGVSPTLTIQANALRIADRLVQCDAAH